MRRLGLEVLEGEFAVSRLDADSPIPDWATRGPFNTVTRTRDELSVVCPTGQVPPGTVSKGGWRCLRVEGPLDFSLTGILASLAAPLAEKGVSIFALSTYDTDYLLVKSGQLDTARAVLTKRGHRFIP